MLRRRMVKLAIAMTTVMGTAGGVVLLAAGTALAAGPGGTASAVAHYACHGAVHTRSFYCYAHVFKGAKLYTSKGTEKLNANDKVKVTCYYTGSSSKDGYWDHVTQPSTGHIDDFYVNFGGRTPKAVGLHTC